MARRRRSRLTARAALLVAALGLGCPRPPAPQLAYDLAARLPVAERSSAREVILFGTPAAEPYLVSGFYREASPAAGDGFVWGRQEADVVLHFPAVAARAAVLDAAPYRGVKDQSAQVFLNDQAIGRFTLNDDRHRYGFALPSEAQRVGENHLRFVFAATASPADEKGNADKRQLAAQFYSLTLGPAADPTLQEDLLRRDAPAPFGVSRSAEGIPLLAQVGPSAIRYAVRLPERAELRFTPELHAAARAANVSATFRVTLEAVAGQEQELWSAVVAPQSAAAKEITVAVPGAAGDIVRIGLHVAGERFAWGLWRAPRLLGANVSAGLEPAVMSEADQQRAAPLRQALLGKNVVFIILDAGRAESFGCYGNPRKPTPEIDRIAAESVRFERAYTPAVYTLGAMASVWTSQHPDRHHSEVSFSARLPKDRLTLAELLSVQGIHTAGFVANAVAGKGFGFDRGFAEFDEVFRRYGSGGGAFEKLLPSWFHERALQKDQRFFAYVHFREPHFPYDPEPPFDTRFGPDGPIPKAARRDMTFFTDINQARRTPTPEELQHLGRLFDGNLAFADQEIGKIRKTLEADGLWANTVVIVAADHGEQLYEHGWVGHNVQLYEQSTHIPLIVHVPQAPAGQRVAGLVDLLDIAPTIADVFGVMGKGGSAQRFQGQSLLPVIAGAAGKGSVLSRTVWDRPRYALRDERRKLIYDTRTGEEELYDVVQDPQERTNLLQREPILAAYYRQALHQRIAALAAQTRDVDGAPPSCEQCENLKSLGYLGADMVCKPPACVP